MEWCEIEKRLNAAIKTFCDLDGYLLDVCANERSLTHRFGMYLQDEFEGLDVDCEYNRKFADVKRLEMLEGDARRLIEENNGKPESWQDTDAITVFPDIIIHKRGCSTSNVVVIEAKKTSGDDAFYRKKLAAFQTDQNYKYEHAVLLKFKVGKQTSSDERVSLERVSV